MNIADRSFAGETFNASNKGISEPHFKAIFYAHHQQIYYTAMRYLKAPAHAERVVEEVFSALWTQQQQHATCNIKDWLQSTAKLIIIDRLKKLAADTQSSKPAKSTGLLQDGTASNTESGYLQPYNLTLHHQ